MTRTPVIVAALAAVLMAACFPAAVEAATVPLAANGLYLPSQADTVLLGPAGATAGASVAGIGDFNGDGRADVAVGAPGANARGRHAGAAYVVFAPGQGVHLHLAQLAPPAGIVIYGYGPGAQTGAKVAAAGDVNHDGLADLILTVPALPDGANATSGAAFVIFGTRRPHAVDLSKLTSSVGFRILGARKATADQGGDDFGASAAGVGDVNGDGFNDVAVGADFADRLDKFGYQSGTVYVILGARRPGNVEASSLTAGQGYRVEGINDIDHAGDADAGIGDVNRDGLGDFVIGARGALRDPKVPNRPGAAYVVYGSSTPDYVDLKSLTADTGFKIVGRDAPSGDVGAVVSGVGDLNGDRRADLLVGAPTAGVPPSQGAPPPGETFVIYGRKYVPGVDLGRFTSSQGYVIDGLSQALAGPGDVNGDGRPDLLLADPGLATLVYGRSPGRRLNALNPPLAAGFTLQGLPGVASDPANGGDLAGSSVAGAGDVNGDGVDDVIVGAPGGGDYRGPTGAYIAYGARDQAPVIAAATFRPASFRVASRGRRRRGGSVLHYTLSQAAAVTIAIGRNGARPSVTITQLAHGGANSLFFDGRAGSRVLRRGRYTARLQARSRTGRRGPGLGVGFAIVR